VGALRFCFVNFSFKLRAFRRYFLDSNVPKASTAFSLQRPRSMLSEAGTQHYHSPTSSCSQTNTPPNAHPDSSAHGSPPHHVHHAGSPADAHYGATESQGVDEKGYQSTDTEAEAKRDGNTWRRERKKRRRKAEIYVRFSVPSHYTALAQASRRLLDIFRLLSPGRRLF
jgi:hypothetical protein